MVFFTGLLAGGLDTNDLFFHPPRDFQPLAKRAWPVGYGNAVDVTKAITVAAGGRLIRFGGVGFWREFDGLAGRSAFPELDSLAFGLGLAVAIGRRLGESD